MMIKLIKVHYLGDFQYKLFFSDGSSGLFDGSLLIEKKGPLLEPLREESYFRKAFIDAGALCWPNGLELAPERLYKQVFATTTV